jgi:23S rRNA (uracil1939-C5)-methyltransferase
VARKKGKGKPGKPRNKRDGRSRGTRKKGNQRPPADNELVEIKLKAMANGGYALGTHDRRTTFVPYTIPGEVVQARIVERRGRVDFAEGMTLVEASADRVFPQCPHFGKGQCWNCQWQHIDYQAQLLLKQDVFADQLYRVGKFDDNLIERVMNPVVPARDQWGYNYNLTLERDADGRFGYYRMDGRTVEAVEQCPVMHPDLQALYNIIEIDFADMTRMGLWVGSDGETMILITMNSENAPELTADLPTSVNVVLPDNEPVNLVGDSLVNYEVGGRWFRVTAGGTFRANVPMIDSLIAEVLLLLDLSEDDSVLDLYAGVGVFSAFIASRAGLVTLVESYPPMATDAEENLADFDNVDIIEGNVEDVLQSLVTAGERYEAAVIDPPSKGLSRTAITQLLALDIPRLVYVSSDPATFARDAQQLTTKGYALAKVQPFDFAPQTYYIDCAALLVKA